MSLIEDPEFVRKYQNSNELEQLAALVFLKRGDDKLIQTYVSQSEFLQWVWRTKTESDATLTTGEAG